MNATFITKDDDECHIHHYPSRRRGLSVGGIAGISFPADTPAIAGQLSAGRKAAAYRLDQGHSAMAL